MRAAKQDDYSRLLRLREQRTPAIFFRHLGFTGARYQVMVGDFIICLLAFFNIFIIIFFNKKKGSPERGPEGGPKGGSRREGPRFVYTPRVTVVT